jgi:predicted aconitase with swiveling domain
VLRGRKVVGGCAEGEAIVTRDTISGWGGINEREGTVIERRRELRGQSFKDKVLVFPGAKGSSGWSAYFHTARLSGAALRAMIFNKMTSKIALGAVVTHAPAMTELDQDPLTIIETGDWVKVDADRGIVEISCSRVNRLEVSLFIGTPCSSKPIFHVQAADTSELVGIGRHDRGADRAGVRGDQQVVAADRFSSRLELRADSAVVGIGWHIQRQHFDFPEQVFDGLE